MRWLISLLTVAGALALASCGGGALNGALPSRGASLTATTAANYIVVFKPGVTQAAVQATALQLTQQPQYNYGAALVGFAGALSPVELARLQGDPRVAFIEPDRQVAAYVDKAASFAQILPWGVDRIDAELNANKGAGVGVAIIDTGIDLTHPDLAHVVAGANFVRQGQAPNDDNGHGTHVAGIVAAANNSFGYVGVAPDATVIAVKVLDRNGSGSISGVVAGINWVAANHTAYGIKVANMSLGAAGFSQSLYNAIQSATNAGVTFVVAAGNSAANAANFSPAGFDNVITVSALNSNNTFAYYSNYGSVIDLIAPGTSIPSLYKNHGYATLSGTSMASPHVAGSAALWLKDHPGDTFAAVRSALITSGEAGTWAGDPDGISEKLVDAQSL
jgi:subtilisin family serine protease